MIVLINFLLISSEFGFLTLGLPINAIKLMGYMVCLGLLKNSYLHS